MCGITLTFVLVPMLSQYKLVFNVSQYIMGNQVYVDVIDSIVWHPETVYPRTYEYIA